MICGGQKNRQLDGRAGDERESYDERVTREILEVRERYTSGMRDDERGTIEIRAM